MESGEIRNDQITASSEDDEFPSYQARLNGESAWRPNSDYLPQQWIQVDFQRTLWVTGVATQGLPGSFDYVESYLIQYFMEHNFMEDRLNGSSLCAAVNQTEMGKDPEVS